MIQPILKHLFGEIVDRALEKGKVKAKDAFDESLAQALRNGAGPAHKRTAVDHALPQLRLTIEKENKEGETKIDYAADGSCQGAYRSMGEGMGGFGPKVSKRDCEIFQNSARSELGTGARIRERHQHIGETHQDSTSDFQRVDFDWM